MGGLAGTCVDKLDHTGSRSKLIFQFPTFHDYSSMLVTLQTLFKCENAIFTVKVAAVVAKHVGEHQAQCKDIHGSVDTKLIIA